LDEEIVVKDEETDVSTEEPSRVEEADNRKLLVESCKEALNMAYVCNVSDDLLAEAERLVNRMRECVPKLNSLPIRPVLKALPAILRRKVVAKTLPAR